MAKRRGRKIRRARRSRRFSFRRRKSPIAIAPLTGGVIAPMMGAFMDAGGVASIQSDPFEFAKSFVSEVGKRYVGIDLMNPQSGFNADKVVPTYTGLIFGVIGHKVATKTGVNRYFRRLPFVGGKVEL